MDIPKKYDPIPVEEKWYKVWLENGYFKATPDSKLKPFTIVIPPPNVTDVLHLGHALNNTIQDIFIRYRRMQGFMAEWLPGVDHAGIATQVIVEREVLHYEPIEKIGKDKFLNLVWEWVNEKKHTILEQLKKLGCSCDWDRTRFTLDSGLSEAVREAFVRLYEKGLIYQGDYIVNWCPRCKTAVADEEVEHKERKGKLYYIKYPLKSQEHKSTRTQEYIIVATTRPETMLGDTACAVSPKDKKNAKFIGRTVLLPLMNREIPVIADEKVDPEFGTGIVKITPAHDPVDFEIAQEHKLPKILILDKTGVINENGGGYKGLERFEARKKVIADLEELGLLERTEPYNCAIGHCYRCKTIIEPTLSKQWFVRMKELAKPAIRAVEDGEIKFYPPRWKGVYLNWMYNIRDWCISRQIWWGHQLPVWHCREMQNAKCKMQNGIIVSKTKPKQCPYCKSKKLVQDTDVLDTWFSSWLWPFSTFGWPTQTPELQYFYPTALLSTAPEIIFFWVARMIMAGYEFMGKPPFTDVYLHGTVRDVKGIRMSKSLGNGIDPRDIIREYGTDALRFSLITTAGEGQDPHIQPNTFEFGRDFTNKIWNAYRLLDSLPNTNPNPESRKGLTLPDRWILSKQHKLIKDVTSLLDKFKLQEPAMRIYDFFWHEFCDWYLETLKIKGDKKNAIRILDNTLRLLHPFIPFITEEIWQKLSTHNSQLATHNSIMISEWPLPDPADLDLPAEQEFELIKNIIMASRNTRTDFRIPKTKPIKLLLKCEPSYPDIIKENELYIKSLGKIDSIEFIQSIPKGCKHALAKGVDIFIPLAGLVDLGQELKKLELEHSELGQLVKNTELRLASSDFLKKAPPEVVKKAHEKAKEYKQKLLKLEAHIKLIQEEISDK